MFGAPYRVAHRAHLHGALLAAAARHPSITIRGGSAVEDIREEVDGVSLTLHNGEAFSGDVLVAADGMRSGIRQKIWPGSASVFAGQIIYRTLFDMPSALSDGDCVNLWMGRGFHCVHYPVGKEQRLNIVLVAHDGQLTDEIMDQCCPALQDLLAQAKSWLPWEARHVPALPSWVKGRVVLLGDSAHGTVPYFAQGSAMALEDAALLADLLRDAGTLPVNFAHLNKRMPRVAAVHQASVRQGKIYSAKGPMASARNLVLRMMPDQQFLSQLAWIYKNA
jgi:salicylate hydroxylase